MKIPELDVDLCHIDEEELKSTVRVNSNQSGLPEVNLNYFGKVLNANVSHYHKSQLQGMNLEGMDQVDLALSQKSVDDVKSLSSDGFEMNDDSRNADL